MNSKDTFTYDFVYNTHKEHETTAEKYKRGDIVYYSKYPFTRFEIIIVWLSPYPLSLGKPVYELISLDWLSVENFRINDVNELSFIQPINQTKPTYQQLDLF